MTFVALYHRPVVDISLDPPTRRRLSGRGQSGICLRTRTPRLPSTAGTGRRQAPSSTGPPAQLPRSRFGDLRGLRAGGSRGELAHHD